MSDLGPDCDTNDHDDIPVWPLTQDAFDAELQSLYDLNSEASLQPLSDSYRALSAQLTAITEEREDAEERNERYRMKLNVRDTELAHAQQEIEALKKSIAAQAAQMREYYEALNVAIWQGPDVPDTTKEGA